MEVGWNWDDAVLPVISLKPNISATKSETIEGDNKIVTWTLDV